MGRRMVPIVAAVLLGLCGRSEAELIIRVDSAAIEPGGSGAVDVFIRSQGGDQLLNQFSYQFQLTRTVGSIGQLEFEGALPTGLASIPNYVFSGNGFPLGSASSTVFPADTFTGGDLFDLFPENVTITSSEVLLTRLIVRSSASSPPPAGAEFELRLVPLSGTPTTSPLGADTYFAFTDPGTDTDEALAFSSTAGTIRVAVVPEPSTWALATLGGLSTLFVVRRARPRVALDS